MARLIAWVRRLFGRGIEATTVDPWLIDRDGRVYKPERKIVLKARITHGKG